MLSYVVGELVLILVLDLDLPNMRAVRLKLYPEKRERILRLFATPHSYLLDFTSIPPNSLGLGGCL